jgi:hypothetical protein
LQASFNSPRGLAIDAAGTLYVADLGNRALRSVTVQGVANVALGIDELTGVAVAADGTVYYTSYGDARVGFVENRGPHSLAATTTPATGSALSLRPMEGLVVTSDALFFSDTGNNQVRAVALAGTHAVTTAAGDGRAGLGVGTGGTTNLALPRGLSKLGNGFAVADSGNHRIVWFAAP